MLHDENPGHPEAQAGSFELFGREERIEYSLLNILRDSLPAIANRNARTFPVATEN